MKTLSEVIGPRAMRALKEDRAVLKIWRQSTPHNWWIESKKGLQLWHSGTTDGSDLPTYLPNLKLFYEVEESDEKVIEYWGSDSGSSSLSIYKLR